MPVNKPEAEQDSARDSRGTTSARITATERRRRKEAEAARLRAQGQSYADIAQAIGYRDPSSAHKAVSRLLASSYREPTEAARLLAMNRLDALRRSLAAIATDATVTTRDVLGALRLLLDVEKREAALLGLDVPAVPTSPVTPDMLDREIERLSGSLRRSMRCRRLTTVRERTRRRGRSQRASRGLAAAPTG